MFFPLLYLILSASSTQATERSYEAVKLTTGHIKGTTISTYGGEEGYVFAGIPMANPPLGDLRFKKLVPIDHWEGIIETRAYKSACISDPQALYESSGTISEDCIYANVFSSQLCLMFGGCSVMVVIHGGTGIKEGPIIYNISSIVNNFSNLKRNVVVVTLPYRTGVLGWFNLAPGVTTSTDSNLAIRDIIFGLEWIQREIHNFGGVQNQVTLMGHSYGATLALQVALSPKSQGLFKQLIHMSGIGTGGDRTNRVNSLYSQRVAKLLHCAAENEPFTNSVQVEKIISCVRERTAKEVLDAQLVMKNYPEEILGAWIDNDVIPDYLEHLLKRPKKLNLLIGTVTAEYRDSRVLKGKIKEIQDDCDLIAYGKYYEDPETFSKAYKDIEYFGDDQMFYYHSGHIADAFSSLGNAYVYSFAYTGVQKAFNRPYESVGPVHSEDFTLLFGLHRKWETFDDVLQKVEKIYTGMVANFVNTGSPEYKGQKWEPYEPQGRKYFLIDFDGNFTMTGTRVGYYQEAYDFWENAGKWQPTTDLPPKGDMFIFHALSLAQESLINGRSAIPEKNMQAMKGRYAIWSEHLDYLKQKYKSGLAATNYINEGSKSDSNYKAFFIYGALILAAILLFITVGIYKCCRKSTDKYETLD